MRTYLSLIIIYSIGSVIYCTLTDKLIRMKGRDSPAHMKTKDAQYSALVELENPTHISDVSFNVRRQYSSMARQTAVLKSCIFWIYHDDSWKWVRICCTELMLLDHNKVQGILGIANIFSHKCVSFMKHTQIHQLQNEKNKTLPAKATDLSHRQNKNLLPGSHFCCLSLLLNNFAKQNNLLTRTRPPKSTKHLKIHDWYSLPFLE